MLTELKKNCAIGGYAGTGKTTLIFSIVQEIERNGGRVAVMAPTGKAANVLANKGVPATTIHRALYEPVDTIPVTFRLKETVLCEYFIVDEASMISTDLYEDILSFNLPVLFIGDPAQLEPVGDDAKIMHKPNMTLTQIHRTAAENRIIQFATRLRSTSAHPFAIFQGKFDPISDGDISYRQISQLKRSEWMAFDQIIVGKNVTRHKFNQTFKKDPMSATPVKGDKLIVLRNDYVHGVFNGETFVVTDDEFRESEFSRELCIQVEDFSGERKWLPFWFEYFNDPTLPHYSKPRDCVHFDYAYAITCHKSQGSEWDRVAVVDEAFGNPPNRWRYTAATRAAKHLTWIKP